MSTEAKKRKLILTSSTHASSSVMSLQEPEDVINSSVSSSRFCAATRPVVASPHLYHGYTKFSRISSNTCRTETEAVTRRFGAQVDTVPRRADVPRRLKRPLWSEPSGPATADSFPAAESAWKTEERLCSEEPRTFQEKSKLWEKLPRKLCNSCKVSFYVICSFVFPRMHHSGHVVW